MKSAVKAKVGVIILAAGNSSRMRGAAKQMLEFQGKTLLRRAAETALQAEFSSTVVVLGANQEKLRAEIEDLPLTIAVNENWQSGMSSSIKTGVSALLIENLDAIIVMLCDQPLVTTEVLQRLCAAFIKTKKPIAASRYENIIGVPALFASEIFDELLNLQNDEGAKKIISQNARRVAAVNTPEAAFDVDTLQDFEKLKRF